MKCIACGDDGLQAASHPESLEVAGHTFTGAIDARSCARCGEVYLDGPAVEQFELRVAACLAEAGIDSGEAFGFMRRALGMRAVELADLLDVAPETISRWERGQRGVDRGALAVLGGLVTDAVEGRTATADRLRALKTPDTLPTVVDLRNEAA